MYDFYLFSKNVIFYRHDLYLLDFDIVGMVSFDTKYFFRWIKGLVYRVKYNYN